jgi:hypothetical protein
MQWFIKLVNPNVEIHRSIAKLIFVSNLLPGKRKRNRTRHQQKENHQHEKTATSPHFL